MAFLPIVMHFTDSSDTSHGMGLHYLFWGVRWFTTAAAVAWIKSEAGMEWIGQVRCVFLVTAALVLAGLIVMAWVWRADVRGDAVAGVENGP
jgi:hypothetical protein